MHWYKGLLKVSWIQVFIVDFDTHGLAFNFIGCYQPMGALYVVRQKATVVGLITCTLITSILQALFTYITNTSAPIGYSHLVSNLKH